MENSFGFGCILSPIDLRDYKLKKDLVSNTVYPKAYSVHMMHSIKYQGNISSCTPHALTTILEYHDSNRQRLSTNFIYGIRNKLYGSTGKGESLREALRIVKDYGTMQLRLCQGNTEVDEVFKIAERAFHDEDALNDAYKHKIKYYFRCSSNNDIKYALMNYGPVLASSKWYTDNKFNDNSWIISTNKPSTYSYHAFVIYGWDENGWLCQNSWGTTWGHHGLFRLRYNYGLAEAFGIKDDESLDSDSTIVNPVYNSQLLECIFKIINKITNWVLGR